MKKVLHLGVVAAVVLVMGLGYWSHANAQSDGGATETTVTGVVESFDATRVTVDGVTYTITDTSKLEGVLAVGGSVKVEFTTAADGTLTVTELDVESSSDAMDEDSSTSGGSGSVAEDSSTETQDSQSVNEGSNTDGQDSESMNESSSTGSQDQQPSSESKDSSSVESGSTSSGD